MEFKKNVKLYSLSRGFIVFTVRYFDMGGGAALYLKWKVLNAGEVAMPRSQFYHEATNSDLNIDWCYNTLHTAN